MDWIHVAEHRDQTLTRVYTIMDLQVPKNKYGI
jgi:hypothetical protein